MWRRAALAASDKEAVAGRVDRVMHRHLSIMIRQLPGCTESSALPPKIPATRRGRTGPATDPVVTERVKSAQQLASTFLVDLAKLMAGWPAPLSDYVRPDVVRQISGALEPFLSSGDVLAPDFGEYSRMDTIGDLHVVGAPVVVRITLEDQSARQSKISGVRRPLERRGVVIELSLDGALEHIVDARFRWRDGADTPLTPA